MSVNEMENNAWASNGDRECSTPNLTREHSERVRHRVQHHFVYNMNMLLTRRSRLNSLFKKRTRSYSLVALNRASDVSAADWLCQKRENSCNFFTCGDMVFISGRNPYIVYI